VGQILAYVVAAGFQDGEDVSTQLNPHRLGRQGEWLSLGFHVQRLVWSAVVVKIDPVAGGTGRVVNAVEVDLIHANWTV
jgi:hypothetical protein